MTTNPFQTQHLLNTQVADLAKIEPVAPERPVESGELVAEPIQESKELKVQAESSLLIRRPSYWTLIPQASLTFGLVGLSVVTLPILIELAVILMFASLVPGGWGLFKYLVIQTTSYELEHRRLILRRIFDQKEELPLWSVQSLSLKGGAYLWVLNQLARLTGRPNPKLNTILVNLRGGGTRLFLPITEAEQFSEQIGQAALREREDPRNRASMFGNFVQNSPEMQSDESEKD